MLTEKSRIENARTPIKMRMKREKTFPKAFLKVVPLEVSEAAIDGPKSSSEFSTSKEREWRGFASYE